MKKNFINWKRTPCSSLMEISLAFILCLLLNYRWSRRGVWYVHVSPSHDPLQQLPYFPTWTLDNKTGNWTNPYTYLVQQSVEYRDFMKWASHSEAIFDRDSPYWWNPKSCYPSIDKTRFNSKMDAWSMSIIAYVKSDNQIQRDLVKQLEL